MAGDCNLAELSPRYDGSVITSTQRAPPPGGHETSLLGRVTRHRIAGSNGTSFFIPIAYQDSIAEQLKRTYFPILYNYHDGIYSWPVLSPAASAVIRGILADRHCPLAIEKKPPQ